MQKKKNKKQQQKKKNKKNKKGMKKKTLFFHVCSKNFRQSATDTLPAFRATSSGWRMKGKSFTILNPRSFVGIFSVYGCWNTD